MGVILALQCSSAVHLGVDHLNVVRRVSRLLHGRVGRRPFELTLIEHMVIQRRGKSVRIFKVKGSRG